MKKAKRRTGKNMVTKLAPKAKAESRTVAASKPTWRAKSSTGRPAVSKEAARQKTAGRSAARTESAPKTTAGRSEASKETATKNTAGRLAKRKAARPEKTARNVTSKRQFRAKADVAISSAEFDAVLFDMDGVVTRTAQVHMKAWKKTFDQFLKERSGSKFKPFSKQDYLDYVDGKPREEGVRCFLKSRKIAGEENVDKLAQEKDKVFMHLVHTEGVEPYETTISLVNALRSVGVKTALVTASRNGAEILKIAHLTDLFDAVVTGVDAQRLGLKGKPAPDVFLEAARRLSVKPDRAVVVEDAEAGVQSGHAGKFKKVIGVAREHNSATLKKHCATDVVLDLAEVQVAGAVGNQNIGLTLSDLDVTHANWVVEYNHYDAKEEMKRESLCTLGNGKFFVRGAQPSARADNDHYPGTYVAGGYNTILFKGTNHKFEDDGNKFEREELVNLPNWLCLSISVLDHGSGDGVTECSVDSCEIISFSQKLNLKEGILYRETHLRDEKKRETLVTERRFVHMLHSHLAGIELAVTALNWSGKAVVRTAIDGTVTNNGDPIDPAFQNNKHLQTVEREIVGEMLYLKVLTTTTKLAVAEAARTEIFQDGRKIDVERKPILEEEYVGQDILIDCRTQKSTVIKKTVGMCTSKDRGIYETGATAREFVEDAPEFEQLIEEQKKAWRSLWCQFDLFIETREEYSKLIPSLLLHLNSFHTLQTASMHTVDLDNGVPARGWTGEGYQGHIFWDDLFVFPFINWRMPNISASLLKYRYRRLREARKIAASYGARGACFPWQSASDGRERTPNYWWMPSDKKWIRDYTRLEIHVNAAVAYNVWQYYQVTGDLSFMYSYGSEIIVEIARFLSTFAKHNKRSGRYEINGVIGPDEFHNSYPNSQKPGLNNNAYTNIMASWVFCRVLDLLENLPSDHRDHIKRRLNITEEEVDLWAEMSRSMFIPVMPNGVIAQFEGYEKLEEFPGFVESGRIDHDKMNELLDKNEGYLNGYKIAKQQDLLMIGFLFTQKEMTEIIKRLGYPAKIANLEKMAEYYLPRTSNQSTLSRVALAWVLSRIKPESAKRILKVAEDGYSGGQAKKSVARPIVPGAVAEDTPGGIFYAALGSDYYDVAARGTARSGIHIGAMAGTVDIVERCFTGLSTRDEALWLDPKLPKQLVRLAFTLHYRGQSLHLDINHDRLQVQARHSSANPITIAYGDKLHKLKAGRTLTLKIKQ
jgi:beta-phosphoglucomutase family hydrolase